jgi:hypothetical protein
MPVSKLFEFVFAGANIATYFEVSKYSGLFAPKALGAKINAIRFFLKKQSPKPIVNSK